MDTTARTPEDHAIHRYFRSLTERAMHQAQLRDHQVVAYVSDMLLQFIESRELHPYQDASGARISHVTDLIELAEHSDPARRVEIYRYIGDYLLFVLGVFPESLENPRRPTTGAYFALQGRRSYLAASELQVRPDAIELYRKMGVQFERCVLGLHWFKEYISDPFYQYMLRQYGVGN